MVAVAVERRVYLCCRAEQRQAVSIRNQAAAWWPEREVGSTRQGDAERLPVEATIQESVSCTQNSSSRRLFGSAPVSGSRSKWKCLATFDAASIGKSAITREKALRL